MKKVKCPSCKEKFKTYLELVAHIKEKHPEYKYSCKHCPKLFTSSSWRYQHQKRHEGLRYKCSVCSKLFQYYYQVRDHYKVHSKKKLYVCSTRNCGKGFSTKRARKYHEQSHSLTPGLKPFVCMHVPEGRQDNCGKTFDKKALLDQHLKAHLKKYITHCGVVKNWPNSRKHHQDRCDLCKDIINAKLTEFEYISD